MIPPPSHTQLKCKVKAIAQKVQFLSSSARIPRTGDLKSVQAGHLVTQEGLRLSAEHCWPSQQQCWLPKKEEQPLTLLSENVFKILKLCAPSSVN